MLVGKVVEANDALLAVEIGHIGAEGITISSPANSLRQIISHFYRHVARPFTSKPQRFIGAGVRSICSFDNGFVDRVPFKPRSSQPLDEEFERRPVKITIYGQISLPQEFDLRGIRHRRTSLQTGVPPNTPSPLRSSSSGIREIRSKYHWRTSALILAFSVSDAPSKTHSLNGSVQSCPLA